MRLVGPAGEQVGIVRIEDALRLASESDLDLVEVAPMAKPPVAKLMDFGKYKYEAAVKAREARKNQTNTVLKEVRFRLKIDTHDYETKRGHARRFLAAGDKVKAMIQFRGREQQRPEMGIRLLQKFAEDVGDVGAVESTPRIDGRNMVMVIGPLKNKAEAKAEARRAAQRAESKAAHETKDRVDVSEDQPTMTQSIADAMPAQLRATNPEPEIAEPESTGSGAQATDTKATSAEPTTESTEQAAETKASTTKPTAKAAEAEPNGTKPAVKAEAKADAPKAEAKAEAPKAESKPAAKAEAPKAEPKPAAKVAEPKPAAGSKPPAAPKPTSSPKPVASPKPTASPKPSAKPAGKPAESQNKPDAEK